jgi:hypothetical protein
MSSPSKPDPLPSWNEDSVKQSLVAFVAKATTRGPPDFVPVPEHIAAFHNDGTLWAEQPVHPRVFCVLDRVKTVAPQPPEWKATEPFASVLRGDIKGTLAEVEKSLLTLVVATSAGITTEEFTRMGL